MMLFLLGSVLAICAGLAYAFSKGLIGGKGKKGRSRKTNKVEGSTKLEPTKQASVVSGGYDWETGQAKVVNGGVESIGPAVATQPSLSNEVGFAMGGPGFAMGGPGVAYMAAPTDVAGAGLGQPVTMVPSVSASALPSIFPNLGREPFPEYPKIGMEGVSPNTSVDRVSATGQRSFEVPGVGEVPYVGSAKVLSGAPVSLSPNPSQELLLAGMAPPPMSAPPMSGARSVSPPPAGARGLLMGESILPSGMASPPVSGARSVSPPPAAARGGAVSPAPGQRTFTVPGVGEVPYAGSANVLGTNPRGQIV